MPLVRCEPASDPRPLLRRLGLTHPRPALFVSGGARQLMAEHEALARELQRGVARAAAALGLALVDGGTDSGVMALLGAARAELGADFPLIGVLPSGILARRGAAILDRQHSHFLLVEGNEWGVESGWLSRLALALTGGQHPCLGLLINGGRVARRDITVALGQGIPLWALKGSGRLADALAEARAGETAGDADMQDATLRELALSSSLEIVDGTVGAAALEQHIRSHFTGRAVDQCS